MKTPYNRAATITLKTALNPHRADSGDFQKWKKVAKNLTVETALKAGVDRGYLRYMVARKLFSIAMKKPAPEASPPPATA